MFTCHLVLHNKRVVWSFFAHNILESFQLKSGKSCRLFTTEVILLPWAYTVEKFKIGISGLLIVFVNEPFHTAIYFSVGLRVLILLGHATSWLHLLILLPWFFRVFSVGYPLYYSYFSFAFWLERTVSTLPSVLWVEYILFLAGTICYYTDCCWELIFGGSHCPFFAYVVTLLSLLLSHLHTNHHINMK